MRSEQWIRTQKRRVRKKYQKVGNMYLSPKEMRDLKHAKILIALAKAVKKLNKELQESVTILSEAVKVISEAYMEETE